MDSRLDLIDQRTLCLEQIVGNGRLQQGIRPLPLTRRSFCIDFSPFCPGPSMASPSRPERR
jgi:hypothetical protein